MASSELIHWMYDVRTGDELGVTSSKWVQWCRSWCRSWSAEGFSIIEPLTYPTCFTCIYYMFIHEKEVTNYLWMCARGVK